jgi:hypothetical protein
MLNSDRSRIAQSIFPPPTAGREYISKGEYSHLEVFVIKVTDRRAI